MVYKNLTILNTNSNGEFEVKAYFLLAFFGQALLLFALFCVLLFVKLLLKCLIFSQPILERDKGGEIEFRLP